MFTKVVKLDELEVVDFRRWRLDERDLVTSGKKSVLENHFWNELIKRYREDTVSYIFEILANSPTMSSKMINKIDRKLEKFETWVDIVTRHVAKTDYRKFQKIGTNIFRTMKNQLTEQITENSRALKDELTQ